MATWVLRQIRKVQFAPEHTQFPQAVFEQLQPECSRPKKSPSRRRDVEDILWREQLAGSEREHGSIILKCTMRKFVERVRPQQSYRRLTGFYSQMRHRQRSATRCNVWRSKRLTTAAETETRIVYLPSASQKKLVIWVWIYICWQWPCSMGYQTLTICWRGGVVQSNVFAAKRKR